MTGSSGAHRAPRVSRTAARQARRKKAKRRQQLFGVAAVIALLIGLGIYVVVASSGGGGRAGQAGNNGSDDVQRGDSQLLSTDTFLLDAAAAKKFGAGTWSVTATSDGAQAPERSFTCQSSRFADPAGVRTWVRQFKSGTSTAVQYVELSTDNGAAQQAFATVANWLATCVTPQQRLVSSYTADGLGDRGIVAVFAQPAGNGNERYRTITVAGSGPATMVLETAGTAASAPAVTGPVAAGADAMKRLCAETKTSCPRSQVTELSLLPAADEPAGFMSPIDLPVLTRVKESWVGVDGSNRPPTDCSETTQPKAKPLRSKGRTYLPVGAKVPEELGIDTKVFEFGTPKQAAQFLTLFNATLDKCQSTHSNVTVRKAARVPDESGSTGRTWSVRLGLTKGTLTYRVGAARAGNRVSYVTFLAMNGYDITDQEFAATVARGAHRSLSFK